MTCIVGLKDKTNGMVYMGADSAASGGSTIDSYSPSKVFWNGPFLMGYTTSFRMGQLLEHVFVPPKAEDDAGMEYMVSSFIPEVIKVFGDGSFTTSSSDQKFGGTFLVGFQDQLYCVQSDFSVTSSERNYMTTGSGGSVADGALAATDNLVIDPSHRVTIALQAAAEHISSVRGPFNVLSTEGKW